MALFSAARCSLASLALALLLSCGPSRQPAAPADAPIFARTRPPQPTERTGPLNIYPEPARTPGLINPDITQANIVSNICSKTWSTDNVRPPSTYTSKLKLQQIKDGQLTGAAKDYEEDHLISLELGGHPRDPQNLWPELWKIPVGTQDLGARAKDKVENYLHDEVCFAVPNHKVSSDKAHPATTSITLARGQQIIAADWYACYTQYLAKQPCR